MTERIRRQSDEEQAVREADRIIAQSRELIRPVTIVLEPATANDFRKALLEGYADLAGKNRRGEASADDREDEETVEGVTRNISMLWNNKPKDIFWFEMTISAKEMDAANTIILTKTATYDNALLTSSDFLKPTYRSEIHHLTRLFEEVDEAFIYGGGETREAYQTYLKKLDELV